MATLKPFAALRVHPEKAKALCAPPYDVLSSAEARTVACDNPLSFLHVGKPEIDLPDSVPSDDDRVYEMGRKNFNRLIDSGHLIQDDQPCYYLYQLIMGSHRQLGLVAAASCEDYLNNIIKKHEHTRPDKENDRVRHIEALNAQTGPVFLTYRQPDALAKLFVQVTQTTPLVDFTADDDIRHTAWRIDDLQCIDAIETEFLFVPNLYVADGHHRSAAAARVYQSRSGADHSGSFLTVTFPHDQMNILAYNRVVRDLNGRSHEDFLKELSATCDLSPSAQTIPQRKHQVFLYLEGQWYEMNFKPDRIPQDDPVSGLDVSLLQNLVLEPLLNIENPRTSDRIEFIGGIRGTQELKRRVDSGDHACAFSMFPTSIEDLMAIADANGIMPPKSTWFEPKLRDGMFCHRLD